MHTTLTPCFLHDVTFFSLKKPRSDPYNLGTWPKVCLWRSSDATTCDGSRAGRVAGCGPTYQPNCFAVVPVLYKNPRLNVAHLRPKEQRRECRERVQHAPNEGGAVPKLSRAAPMVGHCRAAG